MNAEIERHFSAIEALCKKYGVTRLELFGSATESQFDPEHSDFDLIAAFAKTSGIEFVRFADELEALLGRHVDVLFNQPIKNPFLRREIEATRTVILDASIA